MIPLHRALVALLAVAGLAAAPFSAWGAAATRPQEPTDAAQQVPPELAQAFSLAADGDLASAIAIIEALCAEENAPQAAFGVLGGLHVEAGNFGRALQVLAPLADRGPAEPAVLYNAGRAAEGLGQFQNADTYYRRSLAIQPRSPALRSLGMMIGRLGRPEVAYEFLGPWIEANPGDREARIAAAAGAVALERAPEAEALLEGLPGNDPGVKLLRAQVLLQRTDPWGAINELRLLEAEPPPALDGAIRRTLARAYLVVGETEGALTQMEPLQGGRPEDAVILGSAYFQAGRLEEAIGALAAHAEPLAGAASSSELPPAAGHVALEYGRYLHSAGEAARAVPFLRLATDLNPDTPAAFQALGQALAAAGEREEAKQALERFQALSEQTANELAALDREQRDVDDPTGREVRKALELAGSGDVEGALEQLRREGRLAPNDPRPAYAASSVLLHAGRPEEALTVVDQALAIAAGGADGLYQRGVVLMSLQRLDEAEDMFRQALAASPEHTATLSDYAVLLMSEGRNAEAIRHLRRVLDLRPGDTLARQHLERLDDPDQPEPDAEADWARIGRDLLRNQDFKAAEEPLRRAVEVNPEDAALRIDLALALWENNRPAEAVEQANEAVALQPAVAATHRILGTLLTRSGDHSKALTPLGSAVELDPSDTASRVDLAMALWENNQVSEAEQHAREAVSLQPSSAAAHQILGALQLWSGDHTEAVASLERSASLAEPPFGLLVDLARALDGAARDSAGSPEEEALLHRAEAAYNQAVTLAPRNSELVYGLAQVLQRLGKEEEASVQMNRYLELYRAQQLDTREQSREALRPPGVY